MERRTSSSLTIAAIKSLSAAQKVWPTRGA